MARQPNAAAAKEGRRKRRDDQPHHHLIPRQCRSPPKTSCALRCRPTPSTIQAKVTTILPGPRSCPVTTGAINSVTMNAPAIVLRKLASNCTRALWMMLNPVPPKRTGQPLSSRSSRQALHPPPKLTRPRRSPSSGIEDLCHAHVDLEPALFALARHFVGRHASNRVMRAAHQIEQDLVPKMLHHVDRKRHSPIGSACPSGTIRMCSGRAPRTTGVPW